MSNAIVNGVAGAGGGIIAQIITYPLQTVNTRQQTERIAKKSSHTNGVSLPASNDTDISAKQNGSSTSRPAGTLVQIFQLLQTEGWSGLYSGIQPSLVGTAASQGIYYYFYQLLKNKVEAAAAARKMKGHGDGTVGMLWWLVVASIAGSLNVILTNPIWVIVTRMQTHTQAERKIMEAKREALLKEVSLANTEDISELEARLAKLESEKPRPFGTSRAVQEVYHEAGVRGFWKGLIPTLIMVCNPSIQFMIYETSVKHLQSKKTKSNSEAKKLSAWEVFLLGALAKLGATLVTYPLLVVKSRLQAKQEIGKNTMGRYTGTLDAIVKMIRYEGLHGFYKGMGTKIVQSVSAAAVLFMIKEELVKWTVYILGSKNKLLLPVTAKKQ